MDQSRPNHGSNLEMIGPLHPTFYVAREILAQTEEVKCLKMARVLKMPLLFTG